MDWIGWKLCALAHSRSSTSWRLNTLSHSGSGAVMTTSHRSLGGTVYLTAAVDELRHGQLGFFAAVSHGREAGHDLVVVAEPDPAPRHVKAVRVHHEVHGALRPDRAVVGGIPAHQDFVVPQAKLPGPVVAAFLDAEPACEGRGVQGGTFLLDLDFLGGDLLDPASGCLPGRPPVPGEVDAMRLLACELVD